MSKFRDRLSTSGILVADGATGTMLQAAGLPRGCAPERWNLENPHAIIDLHRKYIDSGADIILTNTFGGTPIRLERDRLADKAYEINRTAAELAAQASQGKALVLGDIGPTGQLMKPYGPLQAEAAVEAFAVQASGLAEGGVDAIIIETMSDLKEVFAAIEGVKKACDLPILVSLSFDTNGHTMMGVKPGTAAEEIWAAGVDAVGANCGRTLVENLAAVEAMREQVPEAVLLAKPNAGLPRMETSSSGELSLTDLIYDVTPEIMAEYAVRFAEAGVKIFGGCCGSSPEHICAVADVLHKKFS
jgi:methionine synthase I (cobalamin-dependent)